ncbi:hypothetical protein [Pedobacter agri]|uniref:Uncharacterized protein n=1 Tax=Pedobacter agri TaxID=454586 RepID=A0A9X3DCC8_9SPHI|nr:hypothetical protein [Pedobacter agri]MCX3264804.1 hypothetical protein [Pedobacter agri]
MPYDKISKNTHCDCLTDAHEDLTNFFARSVKRAPSLKNSDFKNHIERNKIPSDESKCEEVCGYNGVSIELWNDSSSSLLLEKYKYSAAISPQFKKNLCIIKFKANKGLVKHTPNQIVYNEYHYDFYKEDSFTVEDVELIDMIPLTIV